MPAARTSTDRGVIVIVRTGDPAPSVAEHRGDFPRMIREAIGDAWPGGYAVVDARAEAPPAPDGAAAFVITGSASSVPSREPWIVATEAWLREVARARTPALGICFGHQILAQALGGEVRRNPRGREIGTIRVERRGEHADPLFAGVPEVFEANATHVDTVARLPPGATSLARSTLDDHHAIRFADALYGLQFHPEFDASIMRGYLEARRDVCRDEGIDADALRERVLETAASRGLLGAFVRRFVTRAI